MQIRHIGILVTNIDEAIKFYIDLLGFQIISVDILQGNYLQKLFGLPIETNKITLRYIKLSDDNNHILELWEFIEPKDIDFSSDAHIAITVNNIDNIYKKLKENNIEIVSEPILIPNTNTKVCFCYDLDKNIIELVEDLK